MNLADNISYNLHDLEDALSLNMITHEQWLNYFEDKSYLLNDYSIKHKRPELGFDKLTSKLFSKKGWKRKEAIGCLVSLMISNLIVVENGSGCKHPLLRYEVKLIENIEELRALLCKIVYEIVIKDENVQQLEFKGQKLVMQLFQVLATDPERFLPKSTKKIWLHAGENVPKGEKRDVQTRVISDFIADMTDDYATKFYEKFFIPHKGSIFDKL